MENILQSNKKYHLWDFILIPFRICPILTGIRTVNIIIITLLPSLEVLATASFVDTALTIFSGALPYNAIYLPLLLLLSLILYRYLSSALLIFVHLKYDMRMALVLRTETIEKRAKLSYCHVENNDTWDLVTRTCNGVTDKIKGGFQNLLGVTGIIIRVFSLLFILITQVWWAALVIAGISVPLLSLAVKGGKETYKADKEAEKHGRRAGYLHKVLSDRDNVEERTLFGYTDGINQKWHKKYENARKIRLVVDLKYFIKMKGSSLLTVVLSLLIIGVLLIPLSNHEITIGMFMGLVTATLNLIQMMSWELAGTTRQLANNREYLKDLTAFFGLSEQEGALSLPSSSPIPFESIAFQNVSFKYPDTDKYILKDVSLTLQKNLHYAFVGVNGAGKTTLTKLLTGMYDNYEGEIFINGKNLRTYQLAKLKALFSVVYQDFAQYNIAMKDNIALGNVLLKDEEKMKEAAWTIGLASVIDKLPKGMDTPLGKIKEGGMDLSGGEWQRVAIARTLYNPAEVRILDEPTASLDPVAESRIYEMFGRISRGKSTIFITHRLGAAKLADEIIVLDDGRVAEKGSHTALMEKEGLYAHMFDSQRSWYL